MRRVTVTGTKLEVSALAYGTSDWGAIDAPWQELYDTYREAGGNCFDTAHAYAFWKDAEGASERMLGSCFKARDQRSDVVIMTKGGHPADLPRYQQPDHHLGPEPIARQVEQSLERLGVDYIDLYWLHRDDPRVPVGEIIDALWPHVKSGKLRNLGASHWVPARIDAANAYAKEHGIMGFCASQMGFNFGYPSAPRGPYPRKDRDWHELRQLPLFAFASTANGYFASGQHPSFDNPVSQARLSRARKLGAELSATANQVALAWLMFQPFCVIPLTGTTKRDHLSDACGAGKLTLTPEQVRWLEGDEGDLESQS